MDSLAAALRLPPRAFLASRWPWRALAWCAQAGVAAAILAGLVAVAVIPAASGAWDLSSSPGWWVAEAGALAVGLGGIVLVTAWQRSAVTIVGFPPIPSRSAWSAPDARRPGGVLRGVVDDVVAALVLAPWAVAGAALSWLGWLAGPAVAVVGAVALVAGSASGADRGAAGLLAVGGVVVTIACPWLWGWVALGAVRCLRRVFDPVGDIAARQVAERQAATIRLSDAFVAERRRIERDLHDGAQQRIVAQGMTLGRARHALADVGDGERALQLMDQAIEENRRILDDLRSLVRSVRPQVLADLGLGAAIDEVAARCGVPVEVRVDLPSSPDPRPGELVEQTAYFVVLEALTNAVKHARPEAITVDVHREAEGIAVAGVDDGDGGAEVHDGGGLAGLVDRVAAIGGRLAVSSPRGGPTAVRARIPWTLPRGVLRQGDRPLGAGS